jgi:cellulose biosynthesis protein BcsQ
MAIKISLFNHKGGVSKTTTTFNLGWMLAEQGNNVILVDADPQCNLSGSILDYRSPEDFEQFYIEEPKKNIKSGLEPAFESQPKKIDSIDCIQVPGRDNLWLLPGHIRLSEYEVTLGIAQELSGSIQTLKNLPGSFSYLLDKTADNHEADYILLDLSPSLGAINQNLLMISDTFLVPATPDYFSLMAVQSLNTILPRWSEWRFNAARAESLKDATYPFPDVSPKFLGTVIQNYRPRKGTPTLGFQRRINEINMYVRDYLFPTLKDNKMTFSDDVYEQLDSFIDNYCLSLVPDFNTLIAKAEENHIPVFALEESHLQQGGAILEKSKEKVQEFRNLFESLANKVSTLIRS